MISYWKTQWFRVICGTVSIVLFIIFLFQPGADESTLEGLRENLNNCFAALCWFINSMFWFVASIIEYNCDRIKLLEKKQERDDAMFELVQELLNANKIDRERATQLEARVKQLEGRR
jgi:hypothetical protein